MTTWTAVPFTPATQLVLLLTVAVSAAAGYIGFAMAFTQYWESVFRRGRVSAAFRAPAADQPPRPAAASPTRGPGGSPHRSDGRTYYHCPRHGTCYGYGDCPACANEKAR